MRSTKLAWVVGLGVAALASAWMVVWYQTSYPSRKHAMTELTSSMHSFCVGRFLVDVPVQARPGKLSQLIHGMGQIEISNNVKHDAYVSLAVGKETELRASPHKTEGTVLHEVWRSLEPAATVFSFRESEYASEQFKMLAYFWRDDSMLTFHYGASNEGIQESKDDLMRAFSSIRPRSNDEVPQAAGCCIESAFLPGSGLRFEQVGALFDFPEYPSLRVIVNTDVTATPDDEGLLARSDRHTPAFYLSFPDASVQTLRRAKRTVHDAAGEELVEVLKKGKTGGPMEPRGDAYQALWEFNGVANSMEKPALKVSLDYDDDPAAAERLTREEILALWDAVVSSLRPRPGAF
jgi:Tle cognate immunity protein 4 C-terminal domain/Tle cognate immunity protein 4 N-terminal domain